MKAKDIFGKEMIQQSARAGLLLVIVAALALEATALVQYHFSLKSIKEEATMRAEGQLDAVNNKISDIIDQVESAARNSVWIAQWCLDSPDSLGAVTRRIVADNPVVVGSTVALMPGYYRDRPLLAPYSCREGEGIALKSLATEEYDYPSKEWFTRPVETESGYWSEPYIDDGGGNILMTTYSVPVRDKRGDIAAVLTADLSLDWLTMLVGNVKVYPSSFSVMTSRSGKIMVCPAETLVMKREVGDFVDEMDDTAAFRTLSRSMLEGESGSLPIRYNGDKIHVYFAPVDKTGWMMSIMIPENEIFSGIRKMGLLVKFLQILGVLMLILIMRSVAGHQLKFMALNDKKERMEGDLQIAGAIQMSMVPKTFPPFPERHDLDMSASIVPAKEVGGDLYDFYIRDEKLFFCIGDVSGKGVPASLVMAVTRSLFRMVSAHETNPGLIVTAMNESMTDMNENNMFVTFFCGVLDLETGRLLYCNAGHNAPLLLSGTKMKLPVEPNLPLGIVPDMTFKVQETMMVHDAALFLYTDGLTEAENSAHELFGESRMHSVLHERRSAWDQLEAMKQAVEDFVGDAPRSDDLTMLFIHYLGDGSPKVVEQHLELSNDINQISKLEDFIAGVAREGHLDSELVTMLNLALEEAVSNVIMYAYPKDVEGLVWIDSEVRGSSVKFVVTDSGYAFDPTASPEVDTTMEAEQRRIGGLGIHLVRHIMDDLRYERGNGKNILTMTKYLN